MKIVETTLAPMAAGDFAAWLLHVREYRGWSEAEVARRFGVAPNTVKNWRERGAAPHVALACAALLRDVGPWRPTKENRS